MNPSPSNIECDILVAGAGFAGSLTALALHQRGFKVCLVEKERHPRFAVGESSTPIADMILRDLSADYDLPWLRGFSRYGSWQQEHPEVACGLKRGFSYFRHRPGEAFSSGPEHENELLVAASSSDANSDTNWYRSDFDAFLVDKVREYDIPYFDRTDITGFENGSQVASVYADSPEGPVTYRTGFVIDATGGPHLLHTVRDIDYGPEPFLTDSRALYSHFEGVPRWRDFLRRSGIPVSDYPYDPDHSALHQILDDGWIWMLRFNNGITSIGMVLDRNRSTVRAGAEPAQQWRSVLAEYPSIQNLLEGLQPAVVPGSIVATGRLQRLLSKACGRNWAALPHTVGFIDPLHSTGIAHTLSGVEKIVRILDDGRDNPVRRQRELAAYEKSLFTELELIDRLVSGCYAVLDRFELFNTWTMIYFTAAVWYEQQRLKGDRPAHYLCAADPGLSNLIRVTHGELLDMARSAPGDRDIRQFREKVKERIAPYNVAGLLEPDTHNMYRHTAAEL